ncbi:hypothetical protein B7486_71845, partial [cyanobacterium TDX16]
NHVAQRRDIHPCQARAMAATGAKPSRTAQGVAAERVVLDAMGVIDDPYARQMLGPSMRAIAWAVERGPASVRTRSLTLAGLAARVRWFDAKVGDALDTGIDQVVVVGAGFDSRAWRCARDGVQFYELDHAGTQAEKIRRAPAGGPTFVEADLTEHSPVEPLAQARLDWSRACLFILEGLTMYLPEQVVRDRLSELAEASVTGSRLLIDFLPAR